MRQVFIGLLIAGMTIAATTSYGQDSAPAQPPSSKSIALVVMGPVDPAVVERSLAFAKENTFLKIHLLPAVEETGDTLDAMALTAGKAMGSDDAVLVVLAEPKADIKPHGAIFPEQRVAVVNVASLKPANGDAEMFGRRVEREVMQSIGLLIGIPPCPNLQCVMMSYSTNEELDFKGRNYCPPCLEAVQKAAKEKGVGLDLENIPGVE